MILGLIMAAIFVYIGVNLEPGLNTTVATITTPTYSSGVAGLNGVNQISAFIQRCVKQTLNIGRNLKWQCRDTAQAIGKVVQTTKGHLFEMMAWSGLQRMSKLQLTKRIMIVFAAMIIFGVLQCSAIEWRHLMQTLNIGENLRWQLRGIAQAIGKALETTKGHLQERWWYSPLCNE